MKPKCAAFTNFAIHPNCSSHDFDKFFANGKTNSEPFWVQYFKAIPDKEKETLSDTVSHNGGGNNRSAYTGQQANISFNYLPANYIYYLATNLLRLSIYFLFALTHAGISQRRK